MGARVGVGLLALRGAAIFGADCFVLATDRGVGERAGGARAAAARCDAAGVALMRASRSFSSFATFGTTFAGRCHCVLLVDTCQ